MAGGWSRDGAVQEQIDASIDDEVRRARAELGKGESLKRCEDCDAVIPKARREALPGVRLCVGCQTEAEASQARTTGYNRRGSKDSQLR